MVVKIIEDDQIRDCDQEQNYTKDPNRNRKVEFEMCSNLYGRYFRWFYTRLRYN
jgi:hypothetical protein